MEMSPTTVGRYSHTLSNLNSEFGVSSNSRLLISCTKLKTSQFLGFRF
jgi:hypothetical protein